MAAQLETRGRESSRLIADLSGSLLDQFPELRTFRDSAPEYVTDEDLAREWQRCGKDTNAMNAKIAAWWNDLPDNRAVQGQSTSWEQVSHSKKKSQDELSDKFHDMSMRDRKNRGRSAPPTRGGRGAGRGGRASSVGVGRGGRGAPRGPRPVVAGEQAAATPAPVVEKKEAPAVEADETAQTVEPQQKQAQAAQPVQAPAPAPAPTPATFNAWSSNKSFADVVKNQAQVQAQAQQAVETPAAEQPEPHTNGAAPHHIVDDQAKQGSSRGRGGRGRNARGEGRNFRQKEAALPEPVAPVEDLHVVEEHIVVAPVEQPVDLPVQHAQDAYEQEHEEKAYLNMGKWESAVGGASPEVGSFQFGSFGGNADFDSAAAAAAWSASDQLGPNSWEVDGDNHALDQGISEQGSNAAVNSLFDNSAEESHLHQSDRRGSQPPGFDTADTNAPPGLDGLHPSKHDAPGSKRGHQGRYHQNRGPSQHQQQGMPQQPMGYGHPYGLNMGMGDAPAGYMPYMQGGFGGAVSAPTSAAPAAAGASSSTAAGSSPSSGSMAHMQQPYGAPQPGMMPGNAGYSPYYFYPPVYYPQTTGHYYNRGSQAMYQAPRGPYMPYDQSATGPMYGQYEGMYGMHGVPHGASAPSGKGSSGSKGSSSAPAQHHAAAAPAPDMGLNPSGAYPSYSAREPQPWYGSQQSWGHAGAAPYPQSPQTGGSGSGTGFPQSRK